MCCLTYQKNWIRAKKDIECYKVVHSKNENFWTPFQQHKLSQKIIEGKRYFRSYYPAPFERSSLFSSVPIYEVTSGAIHAYQTLRAARENAAVLVGYKKIIFKCIIPKGTRYAEGIIDDICAKKIKFIEKMD